MAQQAKLTSTGIRYLRTPDQRFSSLPDYGFESHYLFIDGLRLHYLDEGDAKGPVVVLLHGEPSWSYLYRHIIPPLAQAGYRVIAPDLMGFGKSDKPCSLADYTYSRMVYWLKTLLFDELDLKEANLVMHDWGGLLGLRLLAEHTEKLTSAIAMNTGLPRAAFPSLTLGLWQMLSGMASHLAYSRLMRLGMRNGLSKSELAAYDAPFPASDYKSGPRALPLRVPIFPWQAEAKKNRQAWNKLGQVNLPFLCLFSENDPLTRTLDKKLAAHIPGAFGRPHQRFKAGHFLQEDLGSELATPILEFYQSLTLLK